MGQQSLIYSFVARGTVILAEYTDFSGNFNSIAFQCLQKLPASNNKFTYNCDNHTFNYLVEDGYTYCVVAVETVGRQIPIAFLERIKEDFGKRYGGGKAATAVASSLNREFGPKLKEQMQYCIDHPEEISKLAKVKAQVTEVKGVMMENIEKVAAHLPSLFPCTFEMMFIVFFFSDPLFAVGFPAWLHNMCCRFLIEARRSSSSLSSQKTFVHRRKISGSRELL